MADERLPPSLQENILAVLAFDDSFGALIAGQVIPEHFDGLYRNVATAVIAYRNKYGKAPGTAHIEDIFVDTELEGERSGKVLRRTLVQLAAIAENVNAEYVTASAQTFVRRQMLKTALVSANDRYSAGEEGLVEDIEQILHEALRYRSTTLDAGTFFRDTAKIFEYMDRKESKFVSLGFPEMDRLGIGLTPKELLLYLAPKNSGKTWFCVHCGRQGLIQRERVCHISLEMGEEQIMMRYYASFLGLARYGGKIPMTDLGLDDLGRQTDINTQWLVPKRELTPTEAKWLRVSWPEKGKPKITWTWRTPHVRAFIRNWIKPWGTRLDHLVVKAFPTGSLTMTQIEGYLDYLEMVQRFVPTVLIVDYPDLMKIDRANYRHDLGRIYEELRGLGVRRNLAIIAPTQSSRMSLTAKSTGAHMVSEDVRKLNTADTVLVYSQTKAEKRVALARLEVAYARDTEAGSMIVLSQSYPTGQYVRQSALMSSSYWPQVPPEEGEQSEES